MKKIKVNHHTEIPKYFSGEVTFSDQVIVYLIFGKKHRMDGPALIFPNGLGIYYINDQKISSKEEFEKMISQENLGL